MARHREHLPLNEYGRLLPEDTFLTRDTLANRFVIKMHGHDGKPVPLGTVGEYDVRCWVEPAKTFGFVARRTRWWSRGV